MGQLLVFSSTLFFVHYSPTPGSWIVVIAAEVKCYSETFSLEDQKSSQKEKIGRSNKKGSSEVHVQKIKFFLLPFKLIPKLGIYGSLLWMLIKTRESKPADTTSLIQTGHQAACTWKIQTTNLLKTQLKMQIVQRMWEEIYSQNLKTFTMC